MSYRTTSVLISFRVNARRHSNAMVRSTDSYLLRGNERGNAPWQEHLQADQLQGECAREHSNISQVQSREKKCEKKHSKATVRSIGSCLLRGNVRGNTCRLIRSRGNVRENTPSSSQLQEI